MRSAAPLLAFAMLLGAGAVQAQDAPNLTAASDDGVRSFNSDDVPTFSIADDGTVDWPTFSGYRRYHADCHVCHGPDGEGSSYAPALKASAMRMDYYDFVGVVASGRQKVGAAENQVMPAFGTNPNVMCYIDDIWTYLRARGAEAIPRGRPAKRADKSDAFAEAEKACMESG
jgi:methanol metabolism-related c-type cytochrome